MQVSFLGAAQTVTGSCYLVEAVGKRFLVDCGMFQGNKELREYNRQDFGFNPGEIDFLLLTHAHIDHCGLIPRLYKSGFRNPVYTTRATADLCKISLPDSGHIQELEAEWRNRKNLRKGLPEEAPLYTAVDALASLQHFQGVDYEATIEPAPGIQVRFLDAGHIMGSAIIELWVRENGKTVKVVFSGDLGQKDQPIIKDPTWVAEADYIVVESTYGNRLHEDNTGKIEQLKQIILSSTTGKGNLVIPAFAIGRTQDLLYHLRNLLLEGAIPGIPVYIDSPMAISVTEIYHNHPGYYDDQTLAMLQSGHDPFVFPNLHFVRTAEESIALNETANGAIIISASGMCESGRILHHLKHNVWRPQSHILFVGYQAEGTLGRRLMEGAKAVKILGEEVEVQAQIHSIGGFSAHADQRGLLEWLGGFKVKPRGIFVVHGEKEAQTQLAGLIRQQMGTEVLIPGLKERYALAETARPEVAVPLAVPRRSADYFVQNRVISDLEHALMSLRIQFRKSGGDPHMKTEIAAMKKMLEELETLINV